MGACDSAPRSLGIREASVSWPVIGDTTQIETGEVTSPLHRIIMSGRVPALTRHRAAHGGR